MMTRIVPQLLCFVGLLACAPSSSAAQGSQDEPDVTAAAVTSQAASDFDWSRALGKNGSLRVINVSGDIDVVRASGSKARVRGTKSGRDAADLSIEVQESGGTVTISPKYPKRNNTDASVAFVVELPAGIDFRANVVSGSIRANDVDAPLELESVSGSVEASGSSDIQVSTVSGSASVKLPASTRRAKVNAVNGRVQVTIPEALGLKLFAATLNGKIDSDLPLERHEGMVGAKAEATRGDGGAKIDLETVNGAIEIRKG